MSRLDIGSGIASYCEANLRPDVPDRVWKDCLACSELDGFFNLFSGDGGNASKNGSFHEVSEEYGIMSGNGTFHPYKDNEDFVTLFVCAICWMVFWIAFCAFFEWLGCRKAKREAEKLAALEELADWTEFDRHLGREKYAYERLKTV
ncbi:hypothetical protein LTR09_002031 [Extremus antarcticus]|uniref:Uncharacterized protein n=1 Tax=Extremus antarcticus TaxID=702011 RepID=A0AAJ0GGB2_9PEZI|nr:hypothetical protein LTR09_002031 [Extremus antarcticus]